MARHEAWWRMGRAGVAGILVGAALLASCSRGEQPATAQGPDEASAAKTAPDAVPGEMAVRLNGTLSFTSSQAFRQGTPRQGMSYTREFAADCAFSQPATQWTDEATGKLHFRLTESEPGVIASDAKGSAKASGVGQTVDADHEPQLSETSTVKLAGPVTRCLMTRLEDAQFGEGNDMYLEFDVALTGIAETRTSSGNVIQMTATGGQALPQMLEKRNDGAGVMFTLVNDPSNTGMHLHASPLRLQPPLGARPEGEDPEVKLRQQIYDGMVARPQTTWTGLKFDANRKAWSFSGEHTTSAGSLHRLRVNIEAVPLAGR